MARIKNIEAFCSVCNTTTKMELAGDVPVFNAENKKWAKCKKCKQMMIVEIGANAEQAKSVSEKPSVEKIVYDNCSEYSPQKTFDVGESIYHKTWDDYGMVVSKAISSTGQNSIVVEFVKSGQKKLIESILKI